MSPTLRLSPCLYYEANVGKHLYKLGNPEAKMNLLAPYLTVFELVAFFVDFLKEKKSRRVIGRGTSKIFSLIDVVRLIP